MGPIVSIFDARHVLWASHREKDNHEVRGGDWQYVLVQESYSFWPRRNGSFGVAHGLVCACAEIHVQPVGAKSSFDVGMLHGVDVQDVPGGRSVVEVWTRVRGNVPAPLREAPGEELRSPALKAGMGVAPC